MTGLPRPWCCPEPRCEVLWQVKDPSAGPLAEPQPGQAWSCWGRLSEEVHFTYDGVPHANALKSCHYTPLKGVVAYHENRADWEVLATGYQRAINALDAPERAAPPPPSADARMTEGYERARRELEAEGLLHSQLRERLEATGESRVEYGPA
mgnify:CR=1 FL=1